MRSETMSFTGGERVTFSSQGESIVGRLFPAAFSNGPAPAVAVLGPMTFQKEQAPMLYAQRLSQLGYATLIFDTRYRGESGGEPRCYENPRAKGEDLQAALAYLGNRAEIDADRLAVLGICMGASHVLPVAADSQHVRAVATVAAHLRDKAADANWLGSEAAVAARLARGQAALTKYKETGEVDYVPAVDVARTDVGMPGELVWSWYQLWADRKLWENRYAVMSDAALFSFESISAAAWLSKPLLVIHSDQCAQPEAAYRHFCVAPTKDKRLIWEEETRHLQYYDDPKVIDRAVCNIVDWFAQHLGTGQRARNLSAIHRFFSLLREKDIAGWSTLWDENGRIWIPYPVAGFPTTIEGKAQIVAAFERLFAGFISFDPRISDIYPTLDPDVIVVEWNGSAQLRATGQMYQSNPITVFKFRNGRIVAYHDYFNPEKFQVVVDALNASS